MYREAKTRWTEWHLAWVRRQHFETAGLDALVGQHLAISEARLRQPELMDGAIERIAVSEPYAAAVRRLCCLRGITSLSALTLLVEVGEFRRFAAAAAFMGFAVLVPSEASSGERHRRGSITKDRPPTCAGCSSRRPGPIARNPRWARPGARASPISRPSWWRTRSPRSSDCTPGTGGWPSGASARRSRRWPSPASSRGSAGAC
ncbi:MAG TPA: transposase [Candidatus Limnocylindria bacterium]|nr:transposase [Candidatus Limnocylindria bacterium]